MKNQIEFKLICQQGPSALKSCKYVIDYSVSIRSAIDSTKILGTALFWYFSRIIGPIRDQCFESGEEIDDENVMRSYPSLITIEAEQVFAL